MELTASGNNMLTTLLGRANDERIGFGELTETLDELGEIGCVLDFNGDTYDWGNGVLHDSDAVSIIVIRDGSLFEEVLIDTDETNSVTARDIGDLLDLAAHHDDGSLDVLDVEVVSGAGCIVGSHNSYLLASSDGTTENSAEGVEASLVVCGDHLGDEDHQGTILVAVLDRLTAGIIDGAFVKVGRSVVLGSEGGWELHDDHLKESLSSVDPLLESTLEEVLHSFFFFFVFQGDVEGLEHFPDGLEVVAHDVLDQLDDWAHNELNEASWENLVFVVTVRGLELLLCGVEEVLTPEFLHQLRAIKLELVGVGGGEASKGEGPAEESGTEGDCAVSGVNLLGLAHVIAFVGGDNDVSVLNDSLEVLVHILAIDLEFKNTSVDFVDHQDGLDFLSEGLSEYGLGLHAHTFDVIDDDKGAIGNTESSGDLRGEVDVAWRVDEVDQVWLSGLSWIQDIGLVVKGNTSGLDGNTTFLFICAGVSESGGSSLFAGNDTGFANERVGQGRFTVVDVGNHRHVANVRRVVHDLSDLFHCEVWHGFVVFLEEI